MNDVYGDADLYNRFSYHPAPSRTIGELHDEVRTECARLASFVNLNVPNSREKSLAITKIEEAMMWANAAFARN